MRSNISQVMQGDPLVKLVQEENFVGWVYRIDYDTALVRTTALWKAQALRLIVNHIDPLRRRDASEEARQLGLARPIEPFQVGTVRYTSTARLHRRDEAEKVPVCVQPSDFLARRTAVLGMTRTGKSNM